MIEKLTNPKTDNYFRFKSIVLGNEMPWYYEENTLSYKTDENDPPLLSHTFLRRPDKTKRYPVSLSNLVEDFEKVVEDIIEVNHIDIHLSLIHI